MLTGGLDSCTILVAVRGYDGLAPGCGLEGQERAGAGAPYCCAQQLVVRAACPWGRGRLTSPSPSAPGSGLPGGLGPSSTTRAKQRS